MTEEEVSEEKTELSAGIEEGKSSLLFLMFSESVNKNRHHRAYNVIGT